LQSQNKHKYSILADPVALDHKSIGTEEV